MAEMKFDFSGWEWDTYGWEKIWQPLTDKLSSDIASFAVEQFVESLFIEWLPDGRFKLSNPDILGEAIVCSSYLEISTEPQARRIHKALQEWLEWNGREPLPPFPQEMPEDE